jgi:hypothetical protein
MMPRPAALLSTCLLVALPACAAVEIDIAERAPVDASQRPAPRLEATDHRGRKVSLDRALEEGPVALVFYRGFW